MPCIDTPLRDTDTRPKCRVPDTPPRDIDFLPRSRVPDTSESIDEDGDVHFTWILYRYCLKYDQYILNFTGMVLG